ncbi:uncharacterized protein TNCV_2676541 [Trichonephila clavipes]|nr:uncharacterized protein TNCV_2676541 [Trichonephila clavipes]
MADCEVEGTIASPLSIPLERAMSPTGERRDEARNIRTRQNPFGPQERQTRISKANPAKCEVRSIILFLHAKGKTDVHDEQRTGRPSVISDTLLLRTEEAIHANRRLKLKQLHQIIPEVSMTTIYEVVTVKFGYRKF